MGKADKAAELLQRAAQADSSSAAVHYRLGTVYQKLGRLSDAKREIEMYRTWKNVKDKLRESFHELYLDAQRFEVDAVDAAKLP
jgi:predicted Zn-dependent protease